MRIFSELFDEAALFEQQLDVRAADFLEHDLHELTLAEVQLGLAEGGVGIVTDKNYDKYASADTKAAVEAAQKGIMDGSVKVDTAFDANFDLAALRDSVRP